MVAYPLWLFGFFAVSNQPDTPLFFKLPIHHFQLYLVWLLTTTLFLGPGLLTLSGRHLTFGFAM